jgi:hypothetical protein
MYGYVANNPLANTYPDGREDKPVYCDIYTSDPHCDIFFNPLRQFDQLALNSLDVSAKIVSFITAPRNWQYASCVAGKMGTFGAVGAASGAAIGTAGVAIAGVGEVLTVPAGAVLGSAVGAVAGGVSGLIHCSQGTGPGTGGGGRSRTSANQMQQQVEKGQAPKSVDRVDKGIGPFEKDHVELRAGTP